jgi:hypothetical protein
MAEWNFRLRAKLDDNGKVAKMAVEPLEKDWAEWDAEHPYEPHPRDAAGGTTHDAQGNPAESRGGEGKTFSDQATADQWLSTMPQDRSDDQQEALDDYKVMGFLDTNAALRSGDDSGSTVEHIDAAMASSTTPDDVTAYRVMQMGDSPPEVGSSFTDGAYASTTLDPKMAAETFDNWKDTQGTFVVDLQVPAGTHAVAMDSDKSNPVTSESELLLDRGMTYQVTGTHEVDGVTHYVAKVSK